MSGTARRTVVAGLLALLGAVAPAATGAAQAAEAAPQAPLTGGTAAVPGSYIVVLKGGATRSVAAAAVARRARARGATVTRVYGRALHGFSARLSTAQLEAVRRDPSVAYVEADQVVRADLTQTSPPWGLDRIDQRALPLDATYTVTPTGTGVTAYVIDTGIRATHQQFGGRAGGGFTAIADGRGTTDCNGHGTHVAGTIGGSTTGVAKGVSLVPVRVLGCDGSGTISGVIAGVDWVTANHAASAVANMSLGGGASQALDDAVARSIASGVTYALAAGNSATDACTGSPGRVPSAITVGAATSADSRDTSYSNYGPCVDVFAPGTGITSSWNTSDTATATISGTSMATPHVAGVAALYLQGAPGASPAAVTSAVLASATPNVLANVGTGSPNLLLHSGLTPAGGATPPAPTDPCARPTQTFSGKLSQRGASAYAPSTTGYTSTVSGPHVGCLTGPATADFDLYLQRLSGTTWVTVAAGFSTGSTETVSYPGTPGRYRWRVYSYFGTGAFKLVTVRP